MKECWMVSPEVVQLLLYMDPANTEVFKHCCIFRIDSSLPTQDVNFAFTWQKWKTSLDAFIFMNRVAAVTMVLVLTTMNLPDLLVIVSIH
jgi:hypothetical protein